MNFQSRRFMLGMIQIVEFVQILASHGRPDSRSTPRFRRKLTNIHSHAILAIRTLGGRHILEIRRLFVR